MQKRKPGHLEVSAIGPGCMSMSFEFMPGVKSFPRDMKNETGL